MVDNACVALSYIAEAAAGQPPLLAALNSPGNGLVGQAIQLVSKQAWKSLQGGGAAHRRWRNTCMLQAGTAI